MKENIKAYEQAGNTIRHYSNSSFNVRILSIAQGLGLLTAWVLSYGKEKSIVLIAIPFFGFLFTWLLFRFHMGYFYATKYFYNLAAEMEEKLFDEGFRPFQSYDLDHKKKYAPLFARVTILNAPFALIGTSFLIILVISLIRYFQ